MGMDRHNGGMCRLKVSGDDGGSASSLSDGGWENGESGETGESGEERREFSASVQVTSECTYTISESQNLHSSLSPCSAQSKRKGRGWRLRGKEGRQTVATDQRYSRFEVISDTEVTGVTGRRRLNRSPDLRDLRRPRDVAKMRFKMPTGSQTGVSKV